MSEPLYLEQYQMQKNNKKQSFYSSKQYPQFIYSQSKKSLHIKFTSLAFNDESIPDKCEDIEIYM